MEKKREKSSFSGNSKNVLWALLVVAAAVTVYGFSQAATVSHSPSEITPQGAGSGLDSDLLQGLTAADFLSATGGVADGCVGGICDELTSGYYIGYDWDKDGKSMMTGDCDETCSACYSGSVHGTTSPDGKDQNCNGVIDESGGTVDKSKYCPSMSGGRPSKASVTASCKARCESTGGTFVSMTCTTYNNYYEDSTFNWDTCAGTASTGWHTGGISCHPSYPATCKCTPSSTYY